jgi:hypothetical protein
MHDCAAAIRLRNRSAAATHLQLQIHAVERTRL